MADRDRGQRLTLWPKRWFYLLVGGMALYATAQLPLNWITRIGLAAVPLLILEVIFQIVVRERTRRFDQQLLTLLQRGETNEILPLYQKQLLLRFAAPRHYKQSKLGRIWAELGHHEAAARCLREALDEAPEARRYPLALSLGASLYESGALEEAEEVYRSAIDDEHINVQACANLARVIMRRGGDPAEAELYLTMGVEAARGGPLRLELARLLHSQGKKEEAAWQLGLAETELAETGSAADRRCLREAQRELGGGATSEGVPNAEEPGGRGPGSCGAAGAERDEQEE